MKCDQIHPLIIDYLYDEISTEDKNILQAHLATCEKCRQEVEALKGTSNILQKWEDVEPDFNLMMITQKVSFLENLKEKLNHLFPSPKKVGLAFAYGFVAVFLLLAVSNTEISYQQGNFNMKMALFSKDNSPAQSQLAVQETQALIEKLRQENYYLTKTMIEQSEAKQRKDWASTLTQFNQTLEQKRIQDLNLIGAGLVDVERNTTKKLQRTDNSLNELLRYISEKR